jgi:hypothetical protein
MADVFKEFCDLNLTRVYPLTDESGAQDVTGTFVLPSSLITDIYICAPNLPNIDKTKFYIDNVLIRRFFIDITLGYDDPAVTQPLGVFKQISTTADLQSTYDFIPSEFQSADAFTALYFMTGQITIGDPAESVKYLGSWSFDQSTAEKSTYILPTRVAKGVLNVQYISINDRLFTGTVKLREGANVELDVEQEVVNDTVETTITINASLNAGSTLELNNDQDVLDKLIQTYGIPILTINGMLPDPNRNFNFLGEDCTTVNAGDHNITIGNPCAAPCCDEDSNVTNLTTSIANLNLRYAQLKAFFDAVSESTNSLQNKLLTLGSEL